MQSGVKRQYTPRGSYSLNENYFNQVDTNNKAYLLGLLYADGNVNRCSNTIQLISNDLSALGFFKSQIELSKELYKNPNHKSAQSVSFSSGRMKSDLISLGCHPAKSLTLKFPTEAQVPRNFIWPFILGYFDGDGSICVGKCPQAKFISSTDFCHSLIEFLKKEGINCAKITTESKYKPETSYFRIGGRNNLALLRSKMYGFSDFCLARKHEKFFKL